MIAAHDLITQVFDCDPAAHARSSQQSKGLIVGDAILVHQREDRAHDQRPGINSALQFGEGLQRFLHQVFSDSAGNTRSKIAGIYSVLLGANLLAWIWAFIAFRDHPVMLGTALLAYTFGLRHAVDADHIAVIDNVTRKLMQEGKRPVAAGFFFSLGHSAVVIAISLSVAFTAAALESRFENLKAVGDSAKPRELCGCAAAFCCRCGLGCDPIFRSARRRGKCQVEEANAGVPPSQPGRTLVCYFTRAQPSGVSRSCGRKRLL